MDIQLIAIDLDGTTLINNTDVTPRLLQALEEADARGVHVVPVTGRQFKMLPPFLHAPWCRYGVLCNGTELRTLPGGELLASHYLPPELLAEYLPVFLGLGLPVEISGGGHLHTTPSMLKTILAAPVIPFHRVVLDKHGLVLDDLNAFLLSAPYPFDKLNLPYIPHEALGSLTALLPSLPFSVVWSGPNSMEITHTEATKGKGLAAICRHLGIDLARTMAIGDSGNDVPMLAVAGLSVAMGNAPDFVKAAAQTVTHPNTEDGAAIAIEKYVLGK
ncbi:Cof-like hydrolase [uncultured Eubacteriales bacterium]|uniref:Cof-like hydrolase n=1 Tax=uncultured Eubacteriales bacterium TaxID=172733 RepID=A0A212K479_9FIRM|nr:Cof-like hydrolase [uncultured Eubacteriales bacterium]